jgi:hypothetical protein
MLSERFSGAIHGKQMQFSRGGLRRAQHAGAWQWRLPKKVNKRRKGIQVGSFEALSDDQMFTKNIIIEGSLHDKS